MHPFGDENLIGIRLHRSRHAQILHQRMAEIGAAAAAAVNQSVNVGIAIEPRLNLAKQLMREFGHVGRAGHEGAPLIGRGGGMP